MSTVKFVVVGSSNMDIFFFTGRMPEPGETVIGSVLNICEMCCKSFEHQVRVVNNGRAQGFKLCRADALAVGAGFNFYMQLCRGTMRASGLCNARTIVPVIDNHAAVKLQGLRKVIRRERAENIDRTGKAGLSQAPGLIQ